MRHYEITLLRRAIAYEDAAIISSLREDIRRRWSWPASFVTSHAIYIYRHVLAMPPPPYYAIATRFTRQLLPQRRRHAIRRRAY